MVDDDAHALLMRTLEFPKTLQSLMADYETKSQRLLALNPDESLKQLDSNTISQKLLGQTKEQVRAVL